MRVPLGEGSGGGCRFVDDGVTSGDWVEDHSAPFVILTDGMIELKLYQILSLGVARSIVAVFDFIEKEIAHLRM